MPQAADIDPVVASHDQVGNAALARLVGGRPIQRKPAVSSPIEPREQEAERLAGQVAPSVQMKLEVSQPGDRDEEEADRLAEQVMRSADGPGTRLALAGGIEEARAATERGGQPLDPETRAFMEPRFGFNFGHVRVHTDAAAANAAQAVNAKAYTLGSDIVFGPGRYQPGTSDGRQLLAHELAHVVQQGPAATRFEATVHRDEKPADLDAALRTDDSGALKPFRPFKGITDHQLLSLVNLIVTQKFVTWTEESMLEEAWSSRGGGIETLKAGDFALWKSGQNRGADPSKVQWLRDLRSQFARDVREEARHNLGKNKETIEAEARRLGDRTRRLRTASFSRGRRGDQTTAERGKEGQGYQECVEGSRFDRRRIR